MTVDADRTRTRSVTPPVTRWALYVGVVVLFTVAILSASLAGFPTFSPPDVDAKPLPIPEVQQTATLPPRPAQQNQDSSQWLLIVLATIVMLIAMAVLVAAVIWLIRVLLRYWRNRRTRLQPGIVTDADVDVEMIDEEVLDAPTMRRGIAAARAVITSHPEAGDAIVAAWIGLEETAADSGVGRGISETPAEFTLRILLRRPGIEQPARLLLRLYESVRFGGHTADEAERAEAAAALDAIEEGWR